MGTNALNDPMGQAIVDFAANGRAEDIVVCSDICDDDTIPPAYLFRSYEEMPTLEKLALSKCSGRILDIGSGAGIHAKWLQEQGFSVDTIDKSPLSAAFVQSLGIPSQCVDFFDLEEGNYDTLLMLMNGIGIAKTLEQLDATLVHAKKLVGEKGKIICDSSDIQYLYEDEDGGVWMDLNTTYYGNFRFQMKYNEHISDWFDWLYVDYGRLEEAALRTGWSIQKLYEDDNQYLAELQIL